MIRIWRIKKLAELLNMPQAELERAVDSFDDYCVKYRLIKSEKERIVFGTTGILRLAQDRFYERILAKHLIPSVFSHGAVRDRSIKSNVLPHAKSKFVYKADVADFYPSISHNRVFRFFRSLNWPEAVANFSTRLCTYNYHLALGLVSSPILANQLFLPIDERIAGACANSGVIYTRFVDDITLSSNFELDANHCGLPHLIARILNEHGLSVRQKKVLHGRIDMPGMSITGIRIKRGELTATKDFCDRILEHLMAAEAMAAGRDSPHEFYPETHVWGQIRFVAWINAGRATSLIKRFRCIDWALAKEHAVANGKLAESPTLVRIGPQRTCLDKTQPPGIASLNSPHPQPQTSPLRPITRKF